MNDSEKGYLAGLIDGEGCIFISKKNIKRHGATFEPQLVPVVNKHSWKKYLTYWSCQPIYMHILSSHILEKSQHGYLKQESFRPLNTISQCSHRT